MNVMGILITRVGDDQMWKVMLVPASWFLLVGVGGLVWLMLFDRKPAESVEVIQNALTGSWQTSVPGER